MAVGGALALIPFDLKLLNHAQVWSVFYKNLFLCFIDYL
jgi:hypothetical protein